MTISVNYPTPVEVNGYSCKNCTDVDFAKKHIDPAHPKDGPFGINAKDNPGHADPSKPVSGPSFCPARAAPSAPVWTWAVSRPWPRETLATSAAPC